MDAAIQIFKNDFLGKRSWQHMMYLIGWFLPRTQFGAVGESPRYDIMCLYLIIPLFLLSY
jgi:hypothetical protein